MLQSANVEFLADVCTLFGVHQEAYKLEKKLKAPLGQIPWKEQRIWGG